MMLEKEAWKDPGLKRTCIHAVAVKFQPVVDQALSLLWLSIESTLEKLEYHLLILLKVTTCILASFHVENIESKEFCRGSWWKAEISKRGE